MSFLLVYVLYLRKLLKRLLGSHLKILLNIHLFSIINILKNNVIQGLHYSTLTRFYALNFVSRYLSFVLQLRITKQ